MKKNKDYTIQGKVLGVNFTNYIYSIIGESLDNIIHNSSYLYSEGNYGCDCNKRIFAGVSISGDNEPCGQTIVYEELFLVHKDGTKIDLLQEGVV